MEHGALDLGRAGRCARPARSATARGTVCRVVRRRHRRGILPGARDVRPDRIAGSRRSALSGVNVRRRAASGDDAPYSRRARRDPPSRDVLRARCEGASSSGRGSGDSCGRPYARGAWRSSRLVARLPHAVARARRAPPGGAGGRGRDGRPPPLLPSAARPHEHHHHPGRTSRGDDRRRLVNPRPRRHPGANAGGRRVRASRAP